jgi:hypothetical protein
MERVVLNVFFSAPMAQHSPAAWGSAPGFVGQKPLVLKARFIVVNVSKFIPENTPRGVNRAFGAGASFVLQILGTLSQANIETAPLASAFADPA